MALTAAQKKAARIAAEQESRTDAAIAARTAPAKTQAQIDAINAGVKAVTESTGNVYKPSTLTVNNQPSLNPDVETTQNYSSGTLKDTYTYNGSAYDVIVNQLNQWNLGGLADTVKKLFQKGYSEDAVWNKIKYDSSPMDPNNPTGPKWNDAYNKRFAGNVARVKQGLNALDERTYLAQEDAYTETIKRYGLNNMLSLDSEKNEATFADLMAKSIAPTEFKDRIATAYEEVLNLDPAVAKNFKKFFPSITNQDLVAYFLAPEETIDVLKNKATAAQIGAAANMQNLETDAESAMRYAKQGKTFLQAQADYENVATVLPNTMKLEKIYGEEKVGYNQKVAEEEYLGQSAEAKRKRNRLLSKERGMWSGQSGVDSGSLNKAKNF